jgi:hypothetical protein
MNSSRQNQKETQNTTSKNGSTKNAVKISQPILIPSNDTNQYSLKQNCFNPNNASPPNSWNYRLMQRISDDVPARSL